MSATGGLFPSLIPGGNSGGSNNSIPALPYGGNDSGGSMGGTTNPFLPTSNGPGMSMPAWGANGSLPNITQTQSNPYGNPNMYMPAASSSGGSTPSMPFNGSPTSSGLPNLSGGTGTSGSGSGALGVGAINNSQGLQRELGKQFGTGIGGMLFNFLQGGAGYNPQVLQMLYQQQLPQIQQGAQNVMEQFSATGNRFGSPAGVGLGNYYSQVQGNLGAESAQLYEQSLQNYMNVMMELGKYGYETSANSPSIWDEIAGGLGIGSSVLGALGGVGGIQSLFGGGSTQNFNPGGSYSGPAVPGYGGGSSGGGGGSFGGGDYS